MIEILYLLLPTFYCWLGFMISLFMWIFIPFGPWFIVLPITGFIIGLIRAYMIGGN